MKEREWRRTYWTRVSRENYKGIGLRETGEVEYVGTGTDKNRKAWPTISTSEPDPAAHLGEEPEG